MKEQLALVNIVRARFVDIHSRNPSFSIRGYAKKLGVSPATLSMLLNGRRKCSQKLTLQIADKLALDPTERASVLKKTTSFPVQLQESIEKQYHLVSGKEYIAISEWYCVTILNLIRLKNFKNDARWIADRLGITQALVRDAMIRLKAAGLLLEDEVTGKLSRAYVALKTSDDVVNAAVRSGHRQTLELASQSLENDPVQDRDFSWLTMAIQKKRLPQMKEFIRKFQDEFLEDFSNDENADEIYRLAMQLIPLSKSPSESIPEESAS